MYLKKKFKKIKSNGGKGWFSSPFPPASIDKTAVRMYHFASSICSGICDSETLELYCRERSHHLRLIL